LTAARDADTIRNYSNPGYVLGWTPMMAPVVLVQPVSVTTAVGLPIRLDVAAAGVPEVAYQWLKNDKPIKDATARTFEIPSVVPADAGRYVVLMTNTAGSTKSNVAAVVVRPASR
jgi:hypothetical protein